ncbi:flavin reductase family protein [Acuticoccus mangrovi]|uniref:Flavin reductase family protein n=1 Tax=Acuticoccus mangrovi TaxID=2796142 RepID=A0A934MGL8_9HYPH|nr:flavin reductase family protein [Acuticoccus mangrovi]MBJ3776728.1 flavin reductase family protein [Acuticoccus mangrovi]
MSVQPVSASVADPDPLPPERFRTIAAAWPSGVAVVTTVDRHGRPKGLTMTAVTALSLEPQQFLICVDDGSSTLAPLLDAGRFCINFLGKGQEDVARLFASKREDKFGALGWSLDAIGMPAIHGAVAQAGCDVVAVHDGGDHRIIIGGLRAAAISGGAPLLYHSGRFLDVNQGQ